MSRLRKLTLLTIGLSLFPLLGTDAADGPATAATKAVRLIWFPKWSSDGSRFMTAHGSWEQAEGGEIRIWDAATHKPETVILTDRGVRTVAWSPKETFFAAGDYGGVLHFYDAETAKQTSEVKLGGNVEVIRIAPDDQRVAIASGDGAVTLWDREAGKPIHVWKKLHQNGIWGMAMSADGKRLATAGQDGFVRILDLESFRVLQELNHAASCNGVAFTNDGSALLTGCNDSVIRIFDVATGKERGQLQGHEGGTVTDLQFTSTGNLLVSAGMDQTVRLWDVTNLDKPVLQATLPGHDGFVFGVAISPKDDRLVSVGWDEQIKVWDLATQKELWSWRRPE